MTKAIAQVFHLIAAGLGYWTDCGDVHFPGFTYLTL